MPPPGFQVAAFHAHPPACPPRAPAPRCPADGQQPFPSPLPEPRTLCRSDRRPWAPAPSPEPPAFTDWPVAYSEGLGRGDAGAGRGGAGRGGGPGSSHPDVPSHSQVSVRWEKTRIKLVTDGVWAQSQEGPGQRHQGEEGPRPHTLFVGGLPAGGHSPQLPVRTTSPQLPTPAPLDILHPRQHPRDLTQVTPLCPHRWPSGAPGSAVV